MAGAQAGGRNARSAAQPAYGFRVTLPLTVYAVAAFIWGMSVKQQQQ